MNTGRQFSADMSQWRDKLGHKLDGLVRQSCQELSLRVVVDTPVDTGFLRGSWQPSIGAPASAGGTLDPGGAAAQSAVSLTTTGLKAGDTFFMINNAKYARFLEYGTSTIQPRLFVTTNVKRWRSIVNATAKALGL
jgi:hypothetical protein